LTKVTSRALQEITEGTTEKMSLQTTAENSQRGRCRRDV